MVHHPDQYGQPEKVVVSETEAKQGVETHHMRYVLAFGVIGVMIALFGSYFYYAA
ncbi:hypothetical protein [Methylobrevis pamukkalensis]|uniref:Uncharacterized protein n=1 Tax=Methylobrevis pamukkalensis TaxID=1439726 RepID=A0A1E3GMR5_9HYPH|nr:hypothetical protein [Methylobrevis pamukkalensis]ODN65358.1 hypothetical protein A6302_04557 [Methylobrevis pamukkalensis]